MGLNIEPWGRPLLVHLFPSSIPPKNPKRDLSVIKLNKKNNIFLGTPLLIKISINFMTLTLS